MFKKYLIFIVYMDNIKKATKFPASVLYKRGQKKNNEFS